MTGALPPAVEGFPVRPSGPRSVAAVIPAAGASVRFRGIPKACLPVENETAIARIVRQSLAVGCAPVVVVVGPHEPEIRRAVFGLPVIVAPNPRWALGRTGSIQAGLECVPEGDDVLLWPVDHPFVNDNSPRALLDARGRDSLALWFIPMHLGHSGHPVLLRAEALRAVRELPPSAPLRGLLSRLGPQVRRVPVGDPGVTANVDTPEEYRYFLDLWRSQWTGG